MAVVINLTLGQVFQDKVNILAQRARLWAIPGRGCFINPYKLKVPKVMASLSAVVAIGYYGEVGYSNIPVQSIKMA